MRGGSGKARSKESGEILSDVMVMRWKSREVKSTGKTGMKKMMEDKREEEITRMGNEGETEKKKEKQENTEDGR